VGFQIELRSLIGKPISINFKTTSATRIKDDLTEVAIFAESSYEFLRCFANQKRVKVNKDGVGWL